MHAFVLDRNRKPLTPCRMARRGSCSSWVERRFSDDTRSRSSSRIGATSPPCARTGSRSIPARRRPAWPSSRRRRAGSSPRSRLSIGAGPSRRRSRHAGPSAEAAARARLRYRKPRFDNRTWREGWLPPSLESRVATVLTWVGRLFRLCPITSASQELVKFDLQKEQNPEIAGIEYQRGTLAGYELREYLLEKYDRTCAYCSKTDVPLQVEHIHPKSRGGSDRVSNLTLACEPCNRRKGNKPVEVFLKKEPEVLARVLKQAKAPLSDATAVNATRRELFRRLRATGLPVECGSGGRTKFNRTTRGLPKTHWLDAACVGASTPETPPGRRCPAVAGQGVRPWQAEPLLDGQARLPDPPRAAEEV